ncbi:MAG: hypothetical protein WAM79_17025 [Candidatus Sulfotelmatobacter sp.]
MIGVAATLFAFTTTLKAADSVPQVTLDAAKAGPRAVEPLTERSLVRDYKLAWMNLSHALESNSTAPLSGLFEGTAKAWLTSAVNKQQQSGLTSRYLNQTHKLEAVFYAPEGDVMELHDTAEYDLQVSDGSNAIHNEHAIVRYVVLMTPGADRWVVRQLQAVPKF